MYLDGYWRGPESCWIKKWASQGAKMERDENKLVWVDKNNSDRGTEEKEPQERWRLMGTKCYVPDSVLYNVYILINSIL